MRKAGKQGYPVQESESKDLYAKLPSTPLLSPKSSYASSNTAVNVPPALSLEVHEQSEWEVDEAVVTVPAREWDSTPKAASESGSAVSGLGKRSRWDETPRGNANTSGSVSGWDATPKSSVDGATIAGSVCWASKYRVLAEILQRDHDGTKRLQPRLQRLMQEWPPQQQSSSLK